MSKKLSVTVLSLLVLGASVAYAQTITSIDQLKVNILCQTLDWVYTIALFLAIVFVLVAAYKYITSSGEPEKLKSARNTIIYAGIGVAVALLAQSVPDLVFNFIFKTTSSYDYGCPGWTTGSGAGSGGQGTGTIGS